MRGPNAYGFVSQQNIGLYVLTCKYKSGILSLLHVISSKHLPFNKEVATIVVLQ